MHRGQLTVCSICSRNLWETAFFASGEQGRVCEQCIRAAAAMLDDATPTNRELVLPPSASGRQPDDPTRQAITSAIEGAIGPEAGPTTWATTIEEPERLAPKLQQLFEQRGRTEYLHVTEVKLVNEQLTFVRFDVQLADGRGNGVPRPTSLARGPMDCDGRDAHSRNAGIQPDLRVVGSQTLVPSAHRRGRRGRSGLACRSRGSNPLPQPRRNTRTARSLESDP